MNRRLVCGVAGAVLLGMQTGTALATVFTADFDELEEGFHTTDLVSGGVRFFDIDQDLGGGDNFTIERANSGTLGGWFTAPNVLGFGGYVPGDGLGFGRMKSFKFDTADPLYDLRSARLDIWTFNLHAPGNSITLEGWLGNVLVDQVAWSPGSFFVDHATLVLPSDDYDQFRIVSRGPIDHGVVFADVDNVIVEANPVPEPSTLLVVASGLLAANAARRRR
ncbi:MAG: hypothetical protein HONBIEJF_01778 [Fimbriimonadaceae bacterium]|nr:hypothetical protein [Fimbriimonadaceae bacterium]